MYNAKNNKKAMVDPNSVVVGSDSDSSSSSFDFGGTGIYNDANSVLSHDFFTSTNNNINATNRSNKSTNQNNKKELQFKNIESLRNKLISTGHLTEVLHSG